MATELDRGELAEALEGLRERLTGDPILGGGLEALEALVKEAPGTYEELLGTSLQGDSGGQRYGGTLLAAEVFRRRGRRVFRHEGALVVDREERVFYGGDLRLRGDLVLGDYAAVMVAGDLSIEGNFLGAEWHHSLLAVGGGLSVLNVMTPGELVVGERIVVKDVAYFYGTDHAARAPLLRARVLVENDRTNVFGEVDARERFGGALADGRSADLKRIGDLLGMKNVSDIDQFEERLRRRLMAKVQA